VDELERYLRDIEEKWGLTPDPVASRAVKRNFGEKVGG
jgi:hypothetical protein